MLSLSSCRRATLLLILSVALVSLTTASAQYAFDVKTSLAEKRELTILKQGVISVLEEKPWASVQEVGEDYSLWLTNLQRTHEQDSIRVTIGVSLRTPAMLTRGEHITARHVSVTYDWKKARQYARDSIDTQSFTESQNYEKLGSQLGRMTGMFATLAGPVPGVGELGASLSGPMIGSFFSGVASLVDTNPNAVETMEALSIGEQVSKSTRQMIEETR